MSDEIHSLTGVYVLDALPTSEREAFERHLDQCPSCAREVRDLRETVADLAGVVACRPAPGMRARVLAGLDAATTDAVSDGGAAWRGGAMDEAVVIPICGQRRRSVRIAAGAAAVAATAAIVGVVTVDRQLHEQPGQVHSALDAVLSAPDAATSSVVATAGGTVTAVVSRDKGKVVVSIDGLPVLDRAHTYQVWLIGPDGPRSAGLIHPGDRQPLLTDIADDVDRVAVTTEPSGGSPTPSTPGVARVYVT